MSLNELMATALDPDKCEGTNTPWWFVFDPGGLAGRCMTYEMVINHACMNIHGPFFSRESASDYRDSQRHNLSGHEVVWCGSAHMSRDYRTLLGLARKPRMGTAEQLAELAIKHSKPMMVAKGKDGSWVIYIAPEATDRMGLMIQASIEIERHTQPE